jgi:hypothetical protein
MFFIVAAICDFIIAVAAGFHLYWGCGGKRGLGVSLPQREDGQFIIPQRRIDAFAFGCLMIGALCLVMAFEGRVRLPLPLSLLRLGVGSLALAAVARAMSWHRYFGLFKKLRTTDFAKFDTWLYSPLCLILGIGLFYLLLVKGS